MKTGYAKLYLDRLDLHTGPGDNPFTLLGDRCHISLNRYIPYITCDHDIPLTFLVSKLSDMMSILFIIIPNRASMDEYFKP